MKNSTTVVLLVILALWSLAGVVWFQKRRPHFQAAAAAAAWAIVKAGPIVWVYFLVSKLRR